MEYNRVNGMTWTRRTMHDRGKIHLSSGRLLPRDLCFNLRGTTSISANNKMETSPRRHVMKLERIKKELCGMDEVWDVDFKEPRFRRDVTMKFNSKHRGGVRVAMGLFYTPEEWKEKRKKVLETPLP